MTLYDGVFVGRPPRGRQRGETSCGYDAPSYALDASYAGGRTRQAWDAKVAAVASRAVIALFRCTQMVLYPRA